jgi:L-asparaginase
MQHISDIKASHSLHLIEGEENDKKMDGKSIDSDRILIINTGGTFNKKYHPVSGVLDVIDGDDSAVTEILEKLGREGIDVIGIVYKDSTEMDRGDREKIFDVIVGSGYSKIVVVHGTDTMVLSAEYILDRFEMEKIGGKRVVFTGAMKPYILKDSDAAYNLCFALGVVEGTGGGESIRDNVLITMQGICGRVGEVHKDYTIGKFYFKVSN